MAAISMRTARWLLIAGLSACSGETDTGEARGAVSGARCDREGERAAEVDGCNTCTCSGGRWGCTEIACEEPCEDGATRSDGCNTCACGEGQWQCTLRVCDPEPAACPPPRMLGPNEGACIEVEAYAKDPVTGACCHYGTPCSAPPGWEQYSSEAECLSGPGSCSEAQRPPEDGCSTCACVDGEWLCAAIACEERRCGGWLGDTCTDAEYCAYRPGEYCGAADASSECRPRPTVCDDVYDPVCGCDGETYPNECEAAAAGTGVYERAACASR